jgi:hypothetical protein
MKANRGISFAGSSNVNVKRWQMYLVSMTLAASTAAAVACRGSLPTPRYVGQPSSALVLVPYPPPPARVEVLPAKPHDEAVWLDGEWNWDGRRWIWKLGRWVIPPADAAFSPWTSVRNRTGMLYFATGVWRDARGAVVADPPVLAVASAATGPVVGAGGETYPTGQNLDPSEDGDGTSPAAPERGRNQDGGT